MGFKIGDQVVSKATGLKHKVTETASVHTVEDKTRQIVQVSNVIEWFDAERFELTPQTPKFRIKRGRLRNGFFGAYAEDSTPLFYAYSGGPLTDEQKREAIHAAMRAVGYEELT